jgi:predicted GIY-YIG superfamily endonuclease
MSIPAPALKVPHGKTVIVPIRPGVPSEWDHIFHCTPDHEFVYVFRDALERVLYVGITWSAKARWRTHKRKKSWWFQVASAELTCCDKVIHALEVERQLIKELKPMHNIRSVSK